MRINLFPCGFEQLKPKNESCETFPAKPDRSWFLHLWTRGGIYADAACEMKVVLFNDFSLIFSRK